MTTEFRIDRPGVYVNRCGEHKNIIPTGFPDKWCVTAIHGMPKFVHGNGRVSIAWRSEYDLVAYVGPLPADILQRMAEALEAAEYCPQQTIPATFADAIKALTQDQPQ
jgi:hypothetical protein